MRTPLLGFRELHCYGVEIVHFVGVLLSGLLESYHYSYLE